MELRIAITDTGGDTELTFRDDHVRVKWGKANDQELALLAKLVGRGEAAGLKAHLVDEDGKAKPEDTSQSPGATPDVRTVAGELLKADGELILKGQKPEIKVVAKDLVEAEIKRGRLVLRAQKDGTWKTLKAVEFEPADDKESVASHPKAAGG